MGNLYVLAAARDCWKKGLERFPGNHIMHNEMGNILVQVRCAVLRARVYSLSVVL
jgi:hypothetical protein